MGDLSTLLRVVRSEPGTEGDTEETAANAQEAPAPDAPAPVRNLIAIDGDRMGFGDQAKAAASHAWRIAKRHAKDAREREGSVVAGLARAKLPSIEEQCEYARSRAWVPPGHEDGIAAAMGVVFHALVGRPGVAAANLAGALCARPFRACAAAGTVAGRERRVEHARDERDESDDGGAVPDRHPPWHGRRADHPGRGRADRAVDRHGPAVAAAHRPAAAPAARLRR